MSPQGGKVDLEEAQKYIDAATKMFNQASSIASAGAYVQEENLLNKMGAGFSKPGPQPVPAH